MATVITQITSAVKVYAIKNQDSAVFNHHASTNAIKDGARITAWPVSMTLVVKNAHQCYRSARKDVQIAQIVSEKDKLINI
jgi:hypothetical protein